MIVTGKNVALEVLKNPKNIKKVFLLDRFDDKNIINLIEKNQIRYEMCNKRQLDELANENHQGIILDIFDYKYVEIDTIIRDNSFVVMLDHLEDPHNFGAIIRTCESAGVDGIIIPKDRSATVTGTVMKTSAGALNNVKIAMVTNLNQAIDQLKKAGYWITGAEADGEDYTKIDFQDKTCLVIGSEGRGLSNLIKNNCDYIASIPMKGQINSLNASVAAGILIYEVVKQRSR